MKSSPVFNTISISNERGSNERFRVFNKLDDRSSSHYQTDPKSQERSLRVTDTNILVNSGERKFWGEQIMNSIIVGHRTRN